MFTITLILSALRAASAFSCYQPISCQSAIDLIAPCQPPPACCGPILPLPAPAPSKVVCVPTTPPVNDPQNLLKLILLLSGGNLNTPGAASPLQSLIDIGILGPKTGIGSLLNLGILNTTPGPLAGLGGLTPPATPTPNPLQPLIDIGILGPKATTGSLLDLGILTTPVNGTSPLVNIITGLLGNGTLPNGLSPSVLSSILALLFGGNPAPPPNPLINILLLQLLLSLQSPPIVPNGPCPPGSIPVEVPIASAPCSLPCL